MLRLILVTSLLATTIAACALVSSHEAAAQNCRPKQPVTCRPLPSGGYRCICG